MAQPADLDLNERVTALEQEITQLRLLFEERNVVKKSQNEGDMGENIQDMRSEENEQNMDDNENQESVNNLHTECEKSSDLEKYSCLKEEYSHLENKFSDLEKKLTDLEMKYSGVQENSSDLEKCSRLEKKCSKLENKFSDLEKKYSGLEKKYSGLEKKYSGLKENSLDSKSSSDVWRSCSGLWRRYYRFEKNSSELEEICSGLKETCYSLENKCSSFENKYSNLQKKFSGFQNKCSSLEKKFQKLEQTVQKHENAISKGQDKCSNLERSSDLEKIQDQEKHNEELYKKVRDVLDKLTTENFSSLVSEVESLPIDNSEQLQSVINLVYEKVLNEPSSSLVVAGMCKVLTTIQVPAECKNKDDQPEFVNFRKLLVNRCQMEFEKNSEVELNREAKLKEIEAATDPEKKKELQLNFEEEERRIRMKSVGNIRFIGELFKLGMLTTNIMQRCIKHLLSEGDEESLECLCILFTTIGKDLESRNQDLSVYFGRMREISQEEGKVSYRLRFMLQDVIDLRERKWIPREDASNPGVDLL